MKKSENIGELALALSRAQGEIENVKKEAINPFFKSKYADLGSVLTEVRRVLSKYEIALVQGTSFDEKSTFCDSMLIHSSNQWIESGLPLVLSKEDMQGLGSAISYARRYLASSMTGVAQEDDDGNAATKRKELTPIKPDDPEYKEPDFDAIFGAPPESFETNFDQIPLKPHEESIQKLKQQVEKSDHAHKWNTSKSNPAEQFCSYRDPETKLYCEAKRSKP